MTEVIEVISDKTSHSSVNLPSEHGDDNQYQPPPIINNQSNDSSSDSGLPNSDVKEVVNKQGSVITIFSIWNTMMGTSLLVMPWALNQAGFGLGVILLLIFNLITCYCAYLASKTTDDLRIIRGLRQSDFLEFADVCRYHMGKLGHIVSLVFSLFALLGAIIVYYVLLTNFIYYSVDFVYQRATQTEDSVIPNITYNNRTYVGVICHQLPAIPIEMRQPTDDISSAASIVATTVERDDESTPLLSNSTVKSDDLYKRIWNKNRTVPLWLLTVIVPLCLVKSPTFLAKFTAIGTVSVIYLFILIFIKAYYWGFNFDFSATHPYRVITNYSPAFPSLTGVCSLAFFVHNALQTLLRQQRNPENNSRDICIAFTCVGTTYIALGVLFYAMFPLAKSCIADNFLDNLYTDVPVFIARCFLFFQILAIFPMLIFLFRSQFMFTIFRKIYPNFWYVTSLQAILITVSILFAIFFPNIGTIIQFIGALCGLVYIYTLPPLMTLLNKRQMIRKGLILPSSCSSLSHVNGQLANESDTLMSDGQTQRQLDCNKHGHQQDSAGFINRVWALGLHNRPNSSVSTGWWFMLAIYVGLVLIGSLNFIAQFLVYFLKY